MNTNDERIEKQTRALVTHMNDFQKASYLSKKGQSVIFNKHKQPDGEFSSGLRDELREARIAFAKEWGVNGWRNLQFVKEFIVEAQRPTEGEINDMQKQYRETGDDMRHGLQKQLSGEAEYTDQTTSDFRTRLNENAEKNRKRHKPGLS
jgi:hypothetical protein